MNSSYSNPQLRPDEDHRDHIATVSDPRRSDHHQEAIEIVSKNGTAFLVSEDEYRGWKETEYLLRSPAAAGRLLSSLQNVDAGRVRQHQLLTPGQPELAGEERNPDVE